MSEAKRHPQYKTTRQAMSRISIDVTKEEHQKLKALAALQGKTIKEYVLSNTLGKAQLDSEDGKALTELEALIDKRIEKAKKEGFSQRSVEDIFDQAIEESDKDSNE